MAFSKDSNPFLIKEGTVYKGDAVNPELLGVNGFNPPSFLVNGEPIGYIKMGTIDAQLTDEFATFLSDTPHIKIRQDLIYRQFKMVFSSGQFDADSMELLKDTYSQKGYVATNSGGEVWDLHHVGSDVRGQVYNAYWIDSLLTDGTRWMIAIWQGRILSPDKGVKTDGNDYAVNNGTIEAFPHPNFDGEPNEAQRHYGFFARQVA